MKPAVYICLVLMLFLIAQPVIINCQDKANACKLVQASCCGSSCSAKPEKKEHHSKERTPQDGCNPFAGCSQCQFTATSFTETVSAPEAEPGKKTTLYNEESCTDFASDCWNPPEFA